MQKPTFTTEKVTFEGEKWKEEFDAKFNNINIALVTIESTIGTVSQQPAQDRVKDFISNLLAQQKKEFLMSENSEWHKEEIKKDLINQILKEAPEDMSTDDIMERLFQTRSSYNACNAQWKELLTKLIK